MFETFRKAAKTGCFECMNFAVFADRFQNRNVLVVADKDNWAEEGRVFGYI